MTDNKKLKPLPPEVDEFVRQLEELGDVPPLSADDQAIIDVWGFLMAKNTFDEEYGKEE